MSETLQAAEAWLQLVGSYAIEELIDHRAVSFEYTPSPMDTKAIYAYSAGRRINTEERRWVNALLNISPGGTHIYPWCFTRSRYNELVVALYRHAHRASSRA